MTTPAGKDCAQSGGAGPAMLPARGLARGAKPPSLRLGTFQPAPIPAGCRARQASPARSGPPNLHGATTPPQHLDTSGQPRWHGSGRVAGRWEAPVTACWVHA